MASNNEKDFSLNKSVDDKSDFGFFDKIFDYFSREDIIVRALFIVGVFSIVIAISGMYIKIKNSFVTSNIVLEDKASVIEGLNRSKDTDLDGISDYDELNVYNTSPYLVDTDLDGISDYDQMILGRNLECTGSNCNTSTTISISAEESKFLDLLQRLDFTTIDFDVFKNTLLASGYSKESVDSLSESDFNDMKKMLISEESSSNQTSLDETSVTITDQKTIEKMKNLTPAEIRQFMIDGGGATKEELDAFSDDELKQIYLQTLDEISSSQ